MKKELENANEKQESAAKEIIYLKKELENVKKEESVENIDGVTKRGGVN